MISFSNLKSPLPAPPPSPHQSWEGWLDIQALLRSASYSEFTFCDCGLEILGHFVFERVFGEQSDGTVGLTPIFPGWGLGSLLPPPLPAAWALHGIPPPRSHPATLTALCCGRGLTAGRWGTAVTASPGRAAPWHSLAGDEWARPPLQQRGGIAWRL